MATSTRKRTEKHEYVNRTPGWVGAVQINRKGEEVSIAVRSGDSVFLDAEERELTARAHARPGGNPFEAREIVFHDPLTQDVTGKVFCPALERADTPRATGAVQNPTGPPPEGKAAADEEVGTPEATTV